MAGYNLWTLIHGMGFGALYLLACSGALLELYRFTSNREGDLSQAQVTFLRIYLGAMVLLAWAAVLTGTYAVYPAYRATPPTGLTDLAMYPQRLLLAHPETAAWHTLGMEWKEHIGWLVPISITMAAVVFFQYGRDLRRHPQLRRAVLWFTLSSFLAAGVAGFFGAMINKYAPIRDRQGMSLSAGKR